MERGGLIYTSLSWSSDVDARLRLRRFIIAVRADTVLGENTASYVLVRGIL